MEAHAVPHARVPLADQMQFPIAASAGVSQVYGMVWGEREGAGHGMASGASWSVLRAGLESRDSEGMGAARPSVAAGTSTRCSGMVWRSRPPWSNLVPPMAQCQWGSAPGCTHQSNTQPRDPANRNQGLEGGLCGAETGGRDPCLALLQPPPPWLARVHCSCFKHNSNPDRLEPNTGA